MRTVIGAFRDYVNAPKNTLIYKTVEKGQIIGKVLEINDIRTIHMEIGFPEITKY
jgi:hypothetical protein